MKKYLAALLIIFLICSAAIPNVLRNPESNTVNKTMSLVVYKIIDYNSRAYDSTTVQFTIDIQKVEGSKRLTVWNKKYEAESLRAYPVKDSAPAQTINIPRFDNKKQQIEITYIRIYNSVGYQLALKNEVTLHKSTSDTLKIGI